MPYISISDFKFGLDRRRPRAAGVPGTMWEAANVHISRGGDIERGKKFVATYTLPANTFGLAQSGGQLFVFGSAVAPTMPVGVQYQRLQNPIAASMTRVLDVKNYAGNFYVIAEFSDGSIYHYYAGSRVTQLDSSFDSISNFTTLAESLAIKVDSDPAVSAYSSSSDVIITAATPGTAYTITQATVDGGGTPDQAITLTTLQANVAAVAETRATGTVTITNGTSSPGTNRISQITVNGVNLMYAPVDWVSSHSATANAVVVQINNLTSTHGYNASAVGAVITIQAAPGTGATPNGYVVAATLGGNVTASFVNMAGGVTAVAAVAQVTKASLSGTLEATDQFAIFINGTEYRVTLRASGSGTSAFVYKKRVYTTAVSLLLYCKLNNPADWTDANVSSGAGTINLTSDSEGNERLVACAPYQQYVAIYARKSVRLYTLATDAQLNAFQQSLENTGTLAPRGVVAYGNTDVFYLDETGIRSLKARDVTNIAFVSDIGTLIDTFVRSYKGALTQGQVAKSVGLVEPTDGRFWLAMGGRIFVLSYFPSSKINAWSYYEPGFTATDLVRVFDKAYARDTGTIYLYGGSDGNTYPDASELTATVETPFMSAGKPATFKGWRGIDIIAEGTWDVDLLVDPRDTTKVVNIGQINGTTLGWDGVAALGDSTVFALRLTCATAGLASISAIMVHYEGEDAE